MQNTSTPNLENYIHFYNPKIKLKTHAFQNSKTHFLSVTKAWNNYIWENQYKNLHLMYKGLRIREQCDYMLKKRKIHANLFLFHKYHGGLKLMLKCFSFYTPKLSKMFKSFRFLKNKRKPSQRSKKQLLFMVEPWKTLLKNKVFRKLFKNKNRKHDSKIKHKQDLVNLQVSSGFLTNLARSFKNYTFSSSLSFYLWHEPLPKTYVLENALSAFSRFKTNMHFWSGLQTLKLVVLGRGSSHLLAIYVLNGVRRNRKRVAFMMYLKRLIDWHFNAVENLLIQGIRIETKGRFNAKSRCRKYILSVGRVAKGEKTSKVDYAFTKARTVFGSLGIKVWVCPL